MKQGIHPDYNVRLKLVVVLNNLTNVTVNNPKRLVNIYMAGRKLCLYLFI